MTFFGRELKFFFDNSFQPYLLMFLPQPDLEIEWDKILDQLFSLTDSYLKGKRSFLRTSQKSKETADYVFEGITKYLEEPHKYDRTQRSIHMYLFCHIIRGIIDNDSRLLANKMTSESLFGFPEVDYFEPLADSTEYKMDASYFLNEIELRAQTNIFVKRVFDGLQIGMKRREICEHYSMSETEYDRANARLNTIILAVGKRQ